MTTDQIKHMVDRFLCWKLPHNFNPDAGISYVRPNYPASWGPSGTNLFDASQTEAMVRYMIEGLPATLPQGKQPEGTTEAVEHDELAELIADRSADRAAYVILRDFIVTKRTPDVTLDYSKLYPDPIKPPFDHDPLAPSPALDPATVEACAKVVDDEAARILSKQSPTTDPFSMTDTINLNLRMVASILPEISASIRALATNAKTPGNAEAWHPIETAPKDGTEIIGIFHRRYDEDSPATVYGPWTVAWDGRKWRSSWDGSEVISSESDFGTEYKGPDIDPTHWQPLPVFNELVSAYDKTGGA